jgi:hypothetical protein
MAHPKDWPNDNIIVFKISEIFREIRDNKKWVAKSVKYESFRYSWDSEKDKINEYIWDKYLSKISENYSVSTSRTELHEDELRAINEATIWTVE